MACTLCDLPTPSPPVTDEAVPGTYCCRGCLEVARTLDEPADATRESAIGRLDRGPDAGEAAATDADNPGNGDAETAYLTVEGMHCATCEAFLEARATDHEGVRAASASYPADAVKVSYDPDRIDAETIPSLVDGLGYRASEREPGTPADDQESLGRLLVGGFFGMMTMLWYLLFLYPVYLGVSPEHLLLDLSGEAGLYLLGNIWLMATIVLGYTGYPLFRGAYVSLRAGRPNMDLLVALAAGTAYAYSSLVLVLGGTDVYFDVAVVIVLAVTLGNYYEDRIKRAAAGRLADLTAARVDEAVRRTDGGTETVAVSALEPDDELVVRPGERVPVDGTVLEGAAGIDASLVTGESRPRRVEAGDDVVGGAVVTDGRLVVAVGPDATSTLDRIVRVLWDIQSHRAGVQRLVDRIAAVFVPLVTVLAVGAVGWHLLGGATPAGALLTGLTVLVVSCPCALGLATPLAVARGIREAVAEGIVVTDGSLFEAAPAVDTIVLDKTGTLTTGEMQVLDRAGDERAHRVAATIEQYADHPTAAAITDAIEPLASGTVTDFETLPGRGVAADVATDALPSAGSGGDATTDGGPATDGGQPIEEGPTGDAGLAASRGDETTPATTRVLLGRPALFDERDWEVPEALATRAATAREAGHLPTMVGWEDRVRGVLVAADAPRPEWESVLADLAADHRVVVLTGDHRAAAQRFRDSEAVDEVFAEVPPEGKAAVVERLGADSTVAMVGDGVNDAPALAAADLGIAIDHTALATDSADAVLTSEDLTGVPRVFDLTAATNRRVRQNLGWAFCYNAIALPLAIAGILNPLFAAVAMAASSLLVVGNSARSLVE